MLDVIGSSNMIQGNLTSFTSDRFNNPNSALALNGGWTQVPSGIYFNTPEFTISVWVYPQQVVNNSRIIDFGNGQAADNIGLTLSSGTALSPYLFIFNGSVKIFVAISSRTLTLNSWQFLVATFNGTNSFVYLNGTLTKQYNQSFSLPTLNRTKCFIGKSNWNEDRASYSYLDELRLYNKSLTHTEIIELMNQNSTMGKMIFSVKF